MENDAEERLRNYLQSILIDEQPSFARVSCCGTSRSLYCTECSKLLIPVKNWPASIQNGTFTLPFDMDIILDDRKRSSTGFHAFVLHDACKQIKKRSTDNNNNNPSTISSSQPSQSKVTMFDMSDKQSNDELVNQRYAASEGVYVLFPSEDSNPLSSVIDNIQKLVVLDCKWTRSQSLTQSLGDIPKIHLDNPPKESFFWRWHNAGPGMLSTLEAIYFASDAVARKRCTEEQQNNLIDLMWIFGMQRAATSTSAERDGRPLPFSQEGKELQRQLKRTVKGSEKHLKDIERGKQLKEEARLLKMGEQTKKCMN